MTLTPPWESPFLYALVYSPFLVLGLARRHDWRSFLLGQLLVVYILVLLGIVFTPLALTAHSLFQGEPTDPNLIPLHTIAALLQDLPPSAPSLTLLAKKLLLFFPLGLLLPATSRDSVTWPRVLTIGAACVIGAEVTQYVLLIGGRTYGKGADVDDVVLGLAGIALGFVVWLRLGPLRAGGNEPTS
ncbi:MAG: VanZ family protein [Coriobacteriia bacterium]|nr:VanZ family protein [Coriobacteriia bacterium]